MLANISQAPDFVLISPQEINTLVQVRFINRLTKEDTFPFANELFVNWEPSLLFVASREQFYCENTEEIINRNGDIKQLSEDWVKRDTQKKYLATLREFIS